MTDNSSDDNFFSVEKFESMLKTNEVYFFDSEEFVDIINYYFELGKDNLANQAIKLGLTQHPSSFELKLLKAEQLINEDKIEEADLYLNELYHINPTHEQLFLLKATMFSKNLQFKKAIQMLRKALKYTDDEAEVLFLIGMEFMYQEEYDEAEKYFRLVLAIDSDDEQVLNNLIFCYEIQKQYGIAEDFLLKYIEENPYSDVAWFQLGKQYYAQKKYQDALKAYDYALVIEDTFVGAYIEKGKTFEKLKMYEDAIHNYTITLKLEDPSAYIYYKIGKCNDRINSSENAIYFYKKAVHEDPQFEKCWLALIKLFIKKNHFQDALFVVENAIEINEHNTAFKKNKEKILQRLNKDISL